jgi:ribosomal protein S18 acetylase RimI-like enzyme
VEYAHSIGVDLSFQGFSAELEQLPMMYGPPSGCLLLARRSGEAVGCIGVRAYRARDCEMKRLYVRDGARGSGLGRALALHAIQAARTLGYRRMLLDTLESMDRARDLYRSLNFLEIEPYYETPLAGTRFMALLLTVEFGI